MSCGAPEQGGAAARRVPPGATVIDGRVSAGDVPVAGAYVRLLDRTGEFVAEVVSGPQGQFRFHAAPGEWTVRALGPGTSGTTPVRIEHGLNEVHVRLGE